MNENWESFSKRMAGAAQDALRNNSTTGLVIINATFIVDATGKILVWTEPKPTRIEPSKGAISTLLSIMADREQH